MNGWLYEWTDWGDPWFGEDKVQHVLGAMAVWLLLERVGCPQPFWGAMALGVVVEAIEVVRYRRWVLKRRPQPWPFLCDRISRKDLIWNAIGCGVAAASLRLLGAP